MKRLAYMAGVVLAAIAISSCDEDTMMIGSTLTNESDKLQMSQGTYYAHSQTQVAGAVLSRASKCYLGKVKDLETGTVVSSAFSTQFNVLENMGSNIAEESLIVSRDEFQNIQADSCDIILYLDNQYKSDDGYTAMKMRVDELKTMITSQRYYSDFAPDSLIRNEAGALRQSHMFTYVNQFDSEEAKSASDYMDNITIPLDQPYTSKAGVTYNNYGTYLLRMFFEHPEYFSNSYTFAKNVCPGLFFQITDGLGFHTYISNVGLRFYYQAKNVSKNDTTLRSVTLAATKEVLQTVKITNDMSALENLAQERKYTYVKSPAGLFTEVKLPVDSIMEKHSNDSIMSAQITFQRLNNGSTDKRTFDIPQTLLMIQKDSLKSYFENNRIPDSNTSYITTFTSSTNIYTFNNISTLITYLWAQKQKGLKTNPHWVAEHPYWDRVLLIPVSTEVSSSTSEVTKVEHDMSLSSTRLVGGTSDLIPISIVFARFQR